MQKIIFTGPECSGKTTLSKKIAKKFKLPLVPEYARIFLDKTNGNYEYKDLKKIAKGQLKLELQKTQIKNQNNIIICDTDLQVIKLWSIIKYGKCDSFILQNQNKEALYILCKPDFAWEYDYLRENPYNRKEIFDIYLKELIQNNLKYTIVEGPNNKREKKLTKLVKKLIDSSV